MHRNVLLFAVIAIYYSLSTWALFAFDAGLLVSALVLFALPSLALAHFTVAPPMVLLSISMLGAGIGFLLESIAHMHGLWYSLGITQVRVFGLVPLEMLIAIVLQVLFLGLLYEVFFDDGVYTPRSAWQRFGFFVAFGVAVFALIGLHRFVVHDLFIQYSYVWIVGIFMTSALAILTLHKSLSVAFFDRVIDFMLIGAMPSAIFLWLAGTNVHKVFAYSQEYIAEVSLFGQVVPFEEILLLFALPFFVATIYETYLDDRT